MKELSIEEKAKRYDEAIAMAKECITYIPDEAVNKYMLNMFPELNESEDEGIKKGIIKSIMDLNTDWLELHGVTKEDAIAWLEKQGNNADKVKQQQAIEIPFGAKDSELQEATYHIPDGYHAEINGNEVVIKKGEQKTTWKPTEEQIEALEHLLETIRRHEYSYFHEEKFLLLHSLLEQLKEL